MPQPDDRVTPPPASLPVAERSAGDVTMPSAAGIASWATTSGRAINSRDRLIALAIGVLYAALLAPLLRYGIDDLRLAAVFSSDESLSGIIVRTMLDGRTLSPNHFFAYGALYHELGALLVVPLVWSGPSDYAILLALRAVSLLAGAGALSLLYLLGARLSGTATGLLAVAIAAASPTLARWSVTAHPDTLHLLLMTGCLIAICAVRHSPSRGRLALAAALAGLAFATKYGGALLLPVVLLADAAGLAATDVGGRRLLRRVAMDAVVVAATFLFIFLVTNPYVVPEWRRWLTQVRAEATHARAGHVTNADVPWWQWFTVIGSAPLLGIVPVLLAGTEWLRLTVNTFRATSDAPARWREYLTSFDAARLVALATVMYLLYLLLMVGYREPRYALPLLPGVAVAAGTLLQRLMRLIPAPTPALVVLALALVWVPALPEAGSLMQERRAQRATDQDPRIAAGRWLAQQVSGDAALIVDAYVYVPPEVRTPLVTFGLTTNEVERWRPVAIVVNDAIRNRFRDPNGANSYVDGRAAFEQRATAYAALEAGTLECYRLVRRFEGITVYGDRDALAARAGTGCPRP